MVKYITKKKILFSIFLIFLALFFIYIYKHVLLTESNIFNKIEKNKVQEYSYLFQNFNDYLIKYHHITSKKELFGFLADKSNQQLYSHILSIINTKETKYLYVLQKDEEGRFRFLLDASKDDKANFNQKFDVNNPEYHEIYKTKKPQVIKQKDITSLYLTYLYPIIADGTVIAIASVDISTNIKYDIAELIQPLAVLFKILIFMIFLIVAMTIMQVFYYYLSRKKIFTDPLTKLFNRNYLHEISPSLNLQHYSLALLDLDKFKIVNDTYGHDAGDYVLTTASQIFKASIRDNDILIRYGGEEFLLFMYDRGDKKKIIEIYERIRKNIADYNFIYEEQELLVTVSIGVNKYPSEEKSLDEAIKKSDTMLYVAKRDGRNRIVYDSIRATTNIKIKDIHFVKQAILDNRIVCYFQPIYNYKKNELLKYEALVRIIDIDGTVISPMSFLPNIAYTNLHFRLTKLILAICFEAFKENDKYVSINLNYSDLINNDIENMIADKLKLNTDLASRITFEILESDEIDNMELFKEKIDILHALGSSISIDDFGSGYSNFKMVLDMEADYLKIDGSLIKNIDKSEKDFKVVKNIIRFAQDSNMKTIAEFVHSKAVYDKLIELDVDYMQGYYISPPQAGL